LSSGIMMKLARGSDGHFSHWSFLAVMKQIQYESKMIPSSRIAERDSRDGGKDVKR